MIELQGVGKVFRNADVSTSALTSIDLDIAMGEYVSIVGVSGCGKSTLLSVLGLLDRDISGRYLFDGRSVASLNNREIARYRNREIGFIFQSFNLIGDLTVEQNIELPLVYRSALSSATRRDMTRAILSDFGLTHRRLYYPSQLSGGQQQLVAIARAMVGRPRLLLADEPTGNLDSESARMIISAIGDLQSIGATICVVTHDESFAERGQRLVRLLDGRIVADEKHSPVAAIASARVL